MDQSIRTLDGLQQGGSDIFTVILVIGIAYRVNSYFACHLAGCMATHTIGHDEQRALLRHHLWVFRDDIGHVVFVVFTLAPNICQLCNIETELFGQRDSLPFFSRLRPCLRQPGTPDDVVYISTVAPTLGYNTPT